MPVMAIILMAIKTGNSDRRVIFRSGRQRELVDDVKEASGLTWEELGRITGLCEITLRDSFRKELHSMSYDVFLRLCKAARLKPSKYLPDIIDVKERNWGRAKGGTIGGSRRKSPKIFIRIPQPSPQLAEFMGIFLGDGSLCRVNYTMQIALNKQDDAPYSDYVSEKIYELFGTRPKRILQTGRNTIGLRVNSKQLFEFLLGLGILPGRNKKTLPDFICREKEFLASALRGLFDTDGSLHMSSRWCVMNFKSLSPVLIEQVLSGLSSFGIPAFVSGHNINMTSKWKIERFMADIGSSNAKNIIKFIEYTQNKRTVRSGDVGGLFHKYRSIQLPYHGAMV